MANLANMSPQALSAWDRLKASWGGPLSLNSAYRDPQTNARVGGAKKSQHMHGNAFDVSTAGMTPEDRARLIQTAQASGFTGYGGYNNSLHFDVGPSRTWGPDYSSTSTPEWLLAALDGSQAVADDTMTALGLKPQGVLTPKNTESKPMIAEQPQARGLLDALGIQKMQEGAAGETGQRFYERDTFKDTAASLAQGFAAMGSMPALQKMTADISSQRTEQKARNKTVAYLRANGQGDLADMVEAGDVSGKDVMAALARKTIGGTGADGVQSSTALPDQSGVVMTMRDGSIVVKTIGGETLTGQAALDFARAANENYAGYQSDVYYGRRTGTNTAETDTGASAAAAGKSGEEIIKRGFEAFDQANNASKSLVSIDEAIAAIDNGAESGLVYKFFPDITEASASLNVAMNKMGLDIISSVTFGALSEAEMKLAMETAAPRNLAPAELRSWLVRKRDAQAKARDALMAAATYLTTPGNTLQGWMSQRTATATAPVAAPDGKPRLKYNPTTGALE
jgi:hypothetical protein